MDLIDPWDVSGKLNTHLKMTREKAEEKLKDAIDKYATDHSITHSDRIIMIIKEWLKKKMIGNAYSKENTFLSEEEIYILFSATYLHDIWLQNEKMGGDFETRRHNHAEKGAEEVRSNPEEYGVLPKFSLCIATVMEGHRADLTTDEKFKKDERIGTAIPPIRILLLSALLQMADELDVTSERINEERAKALKMPVKDGMHYYKHYYVQSVNVLDGQINISFQFPPEKVKEYERLFSKLVLEKIREKCIALNGILLSLYDIHLYVTLQPCESNGFPSLDVMPDEVFDDISRRFSRLKDFEAIDNEWIEEKKDKADPELFYKGSVSWADILSGLDVERFQYKDIYELVLELGRDSKENFRVNLLLLTAEAGNGKTTLLFRIGYDLYKKYRGESNDFYILLLKGDFDADQLIGFYVNNRKPLYILIDTIDARSVIEKLRKAIEILSTNHRTPITIIVTARLSEWKNAGGDSLKPHKYEKRELLEELKNTEIKGILKLLAKYDVSGNLLGRLKTLNFDDQIKEFELNAKKQLLVALMETTEGKHFDEIIKDEYEKLKNDSPQAAEGYLYICLLYTYGILTPKNLLQNLTGCRGITFDQKVRFPAPRIIVPEEEKGFIGQFRARHQKIAYIIMSQIDELKDRNAKFERICALIETVNIGIGSRAERYVVLKLLQGLIYPNPQEGCNDQELAEKIMEKYREKIWRMQQQAAMEKKCPELFAWASLYSEIRNLEEDKKCLELIVKIDPYNPRACYLYANVLNKINSTPTNDQIKEIEEYFELSYIIEFRDIKIPWAYINFEVKVEPFEKVAQLCEETLKIHLDNKDIENIYKKFTEICLSIISRIKSEIKVEHFERVAQLCEEALKIHPDNKELKNIYKNIYKEIRYIYVNLLSRLEQEDKYEELINICRAGLKVNPTNVKTRYRLAETLEYLGNKTEALNQYKEITKLKNVEEYAPAWDRCASILVDLGLYDEAKYFLQVLINDHKNRDLLAAKCRNDMACLLVKKEEYEDVKSLWKDAIDIFPDFVWSYIKLGKFYYREENNIESAVKYVHQGKLIAEKNSILPAVEKAEDILKEIKAKIGDDEFEQIIIEFESGKLNIE
ncbi:MAG: hypothetical protein ABIF11_08955 [Nitrospirota bacterium]